MIKNIISAESVIGVLGGNPVSQPVSFELGPKQLGLVEGENGSGKTTLIRVLLGDVPFRATRLEVLGGPPPFKCPWKLTRDRVRVVPQFPVLPSFLKITEYLSLWQSCTKRQSVGAKPGKLHDVRRMIEEKLQISSGLRIGNLSFGQRRMIEILLAAEAHPDLLLADEPLSGLALPWIPTAVDALEGVRRRGTAVLLVVHEPELQYWRPDFCVKVLPNRGHS